MVEESHVIKDRWISFLRLGGEVRGCFRKARPWSADQKEKKSQNRLKIGEWVGGHCMTL